MPCAGLRIAQGLPWAIQRSGNINVPMYERLLNADLVVADVSTNNCNAFYELGVRHALRPYTTITGRLFLGRRYPGTSCQARHEQAIARRMATIALSLRDKARQKLSPMRSLI